jgi:transposase-like protein
MYLFTTSRHGVPAKEIQRQISVTYKTAWRMCHEIRKYMGKVDGDNMLGGHVELDETYVGGRTHGKGTGRTIGKKAVIFGMAERNGDVMTKVVPNVKGKTLNPIILKNVRQLSKISTDELYTYKSLGKNGYIHQAVNHAEKEYVRGDVHTNTLEGFWSMIKRSIKGTHIHVSRKHLQKYLVEFEFRYNMRHTPQFMFDVLLRAF